MRSGMRGGRGQRVRLRCALTQHTLCAAQRTHTLVMRTSLSPRSLAHSLQKKASLAKLAFQVFQNYRLEEQGSEKLGCWKRWETIVRSTTLGGAAENSMCDSDAAITQRWRMWTVHWFFFSGALGTGRELGILAHDYNHRWEWRSTLGNTCGFIYELNSTSHESHLVVVL